MGSDEGDERHEGDEYVHGGGGGWDQETLLELLSSRRIT